MSKRSLIFLFAMALAIPTLFQARPWASGDQMALRAPDCLSCHSYSQDQKMIMGDFRSYSRQADLLSVKIGSRYQIVKITPQTKLENAPSWRELPPEAPLKVLFEEKPDGFYAKTVVVKPKLKIPENQLLSLEEMVRLVNLGPEKGRYILFDSRPADRFQEGHIPGAISMPFANFDKLPNLLPKDKSQMVIFYCNGFTSALSPMAARKAEKLGYTNVKVFHAGLPLWTESGQVVYSDSAFVEQMMGYLVLVDLRGIETAQKAHIHGAVSLEIKNLEKEKTQFPPDKKALIILYTEKSEMKELEPVVKTITSWGYTRVRVLEGGFAAWSAKGRPIQKGEVRTTIFYIPRPQLGEISGDEFVNIVRMRPKDKLILNVCTKEETSEGMLEGAMSIPLDSLQARLNELPKDKEIIIHCRAGLRAEMAYHILRNAGGFKARFLNDKIAIKGKEFFCCYK